MSRTVPIYSPTIFRQLKQMPTLKNLHWFTRMRLCLIPARIIGYDTDGRCETIVWGKRLNGVVYITGYTWSE